MSQTGSSQQKCFLEWPERTLFHLVFDLLLCFPKFIEPLLEEEERCEEPDVPNTRAGEVSHEKQICPVKNFYLNLTKGDFKKINKRYLCRMKPGEK